MTSSTNPADSGETTQDKSTAGIEVAFAQESPAGQSALRVAGVNARDGFAVPGDVWQAPNGLRYQVVSWDRGTLLLKDLVTGVVATGFLGAFRTWKKLLKCSHEDCPVTEGLHECDLGLLCGIHLAHSLGLCAKEQELQVREEQEDGLTPEAFSRLMAAELAANASKGEWRLWRPEVATGLQELRYHADKLRDALHGGQATITRVHEHAADVANISMKLAEVHGDAVVIARVIGASRSEAL